MTEKEFSDALNEFEGKAATPELCHDIKVVVLDYLKSRDDMCRLVLRGPEIYLLISDGFRKMIVSETEFAALPPLIQDFEIKEDPDPEVRFDG